MMYKISIPFISTKRLKYTPVSSSVMHGMLMEKIDPVYADFLHTQSLRPYSQYVDYINGQNIWTLNLLGEEAYQQIARPVLSLDSAYIKHKGDDIRFSNAEIHVLTYEELLVSNKTTHHTSDTLKLEFVTPTAFKSNGKYNFLPSPRLILLSISKRFDNAFGIEENDYEALGEIIEKNVSVSDYKLESTSFSLEGVNIPSFVGNITFKAVGDNDFRSYFRMLGDFAQYSGVGIKTALGMGQVKKNS